MASNDNFVLLIQKIHYLILDAGIFFFVVVFFLPNETFLFTFLAGAEDADESLLLLLLLELELLSSLEPFPVLLEFLLLS
jgi:hypothetical protein